MKSCLFLEREYTRITEFLLVNDGQSQGVALPSSRLSHPQGIHIDTGNLRILISLFYFKKRRVETVNMYESMISCVRSARECARACVWCVCVDADVCMLDRVGWFGASAAALRCQA